MEATVMEHQAGFRRGRGTTDQLFTLNQILNNSYDFDVPTYTCFIDLKKAYDTVNRPALWRVLSQVGLSEKVQRLLQSLHSNTNASVRAYGQMSKPFKVTNGVRQGCVLAPALFNLFLDHVVRVAFAESDDGVTIRYVTEGSISTTHRIQRDERSEIELKELIQQLLYADDMSILCDDAKGLNRLVQRLDETTQEWGLEISQEKTKILTTDRSGNAPIPKIELRGEEIENVPKFKYLGRNFCDTPELKTEINSRIESASKAFYKYAAPLYRRKEISLKNKIRIFRPTVIETLLHGAETWALKREDVRRLESFQHRCIRYILGVRFQTHGNVSNSGLRKKCRLPKIETLLRTRRLRWLGHVARMPETRLPRKALFSIPCSTRPKGGPILTWGQVIQQDLRIVCETETWMQTSQNRKQWRRLTIQPYRLRYNQRPQRSTRARR